MLEPDFIQFANRISEWFGTPPATRHRLSMWYHRVKEIPEEALPFIQRHITDELDSMPRNLPKRIIEGWSQWKSANPGRIEKMKKNRCSECGGCGFIWGRKLDPERNRQYESCFQCGMCDNAEADMGRHTLAQMGRMTTAELNRTGYQVVSIRPKMPRPADPPPLEVGTSIGSEYAGKEKIRKERKINYGEEREW